MSVAKGPNLELVEATETAITVQFKSVSTAGVQYHLQWKEYTRSWDTSAVLSKVVPVKQGKNKVVATATDLQPGTSYCVRLVLEDSNGNMGLPGSQLIIDTEQVGCTPKGGGGCCTIS